MKFILTVKNLSLKFTMLQVGETSKFIKQVIPSDDCMLTERKRIKQCFLMPTRYVKLVRAMFIYFALCQLLLEEAIVVYLSCVQHQISCKVSNCTPLMLFLLLIWRIGLMRYINELKIRSLVEEEIRMHYWLLACTLLVDKKTSHAL